MKSIKCFLKGKAYAVAIITILAAAAATMNSCDLDDGCGYDYVVCPPTNGQPTAIVTVKTAADNTVYLQLDDNTTLLPVNLKEHPFNGKEVRAFAYYREAKADAAPYTKAVVLNSIDSVLTKHTVPTLGERNDAVYGNDPLEVSSSFPTVCEDNYLTLCIGTVWGRNAKPHLVNLVVGNNHDDPYEVELRQNAYGDTNGQFAYTTVAFSLKELPKTGGKTVKLKVRYRAFKGEKTAVFDYRTKD